MRTSHYLLSTLKETPADAEIVSHQLMLRAGMIRKLASGLYDWMPTGVRVLRKIEKIVREEMDNAGSLEISCRLFSLLIYGKKVAVGNNMAQNCCVLQIAVSVLLF